MQFFFVDDIVLVGELREEKLEMWKQALEGFHLSRNKTEYMECNYVSLARGLH